jgi:aspartate-semialdehyde dehydrogenase
MRPVDVIVVGATGLVGQTMIRVLEERKIPVRSLLLLASPRSAGTVLDFRGSSVAVQTLMESTLPLWDGAIALFSAGAQVSRHFAPLFVDHGATVIDNSSAFRMEPEVPLVVPEVNAEALVHHRGIIANPNCSTIQMVVALKPLHDRYRIRRIVVATYQAVTGAGRRGLRQLEEELAGRPVEAPAFPHPIAGNCIPQIDVFLADGYTKEERKMMDETRKIMGDEMLKISATCVRVPVSGGHSEAVTVEFEQAVNVEEARDLLRRAPGVTVVDDPAHQRYPLALDARARDDVFVGRIRRDPSAPNALSLWIVSDNVRKGAATNAVQIAERLLAHPSLQAP